MEKEIRKIQSEITAGESRTIEGYALVFDSESRDLGGWTETIEPGALDGLIERSDVCCWLDHNPQRGLLARSRNGKGTLALEVDGRGLKYRFDAPDTAIGNEVLEGVRRGDICASSFSFIVGDDLWERRGEMMHRTIRRIDALFDVSPVYSPAYEETDVAIARRSYEEHSIADEEPEEPQQEEAPTEEDTPTGEPEEPRAEPEEEQGETPTEPAEESDKTKKEIEDENRNNISSITMKKRKFSLIKAINAVANQRSLEADDLAVVEAGRNEFRAAGQTANGQIVLPVETRDVDGGTATDTGTTSAILATVATQGQEAVATEKVNILDPLRANMVLSAAGATYLTGLQGDISIPTYTGSNVGWKGEVDTADNGKGEFSEIVLKPHRLTAFIDVSKQFLIQDSVGAEEMLQRDIIAALAEKLEATILGDEVATDNKPAGLFCDVTADTAAVKYADIVDLEAQLEEANISGQLAYIASPKAKATLRKTSKDSGSGRFVMEDNEIEGIKVLSSSAVVTNGLALADWRELVIAQWGGLDLTIDPLTKAADGMVRIVINAYFDAKMRRPAAIAAKVLK